MTVRARLFPASFLLLILIFPLISACGKKGPPTLASWEKPDSPLNLSALHREGRITLRWTYPRAKESAITGFIVLKASSGGDILPAARAGADVRFFEDTEFAVGTAYQYRVVSENRRGVLSDAQPAVALTPSRPPDAPESINLKIDDREVVLTWTSAGRDILYNIYKGYEAGIYGPAPVNAAPLTGTSFRDGLDVRRNVFYSIRSLTSKDVPDEGPLSAPVSVGPEDLVPSAPDSVRSHTAADGVYLTWAASPESWVSGYRIYRRHGPGGFVLIGETEIPSFHDGEVAHSARDYRIVPLGPVSEGSAAEVSNIMYRPEQ